MVHLVHLQCASHHIWRQCLALLLIWGRHGQSNITYKGEGGGRGYSFLGAKHGEQPIGVIFLVFFFFGLSLGKVGREDKFLFFFAMENWTGGKKEGVCKGGSGHHPTLLHLGSSCAYTPGSNGGGHSVAWGCCFSYLDFWTFEGGLIIWGSCCFFCFLRRTELYHITTKNIMQQLEQQLRGFILGGHRS